MPRRVPDQRVVVAAVYVSSMLMNSIDSTIVNVALATLSRQFHVPPTAIDAVVVGYLVSLAVFIPASGWLGDRFGTKRIFLVALGLFTGASALCGLAGSLGQLIMFRILQGAGGGMLTPVGMAMLYRTFPPEQRVQVSRILIFATILGPACGPVIGGLLIEKLSWHWAFYVNVPVGLIAFLIGLLFLQEHREATAGSFDVRGFFLAGAGFALVMFALSEAPSRGWTDPAILACGLIGAVVLAVFVTVELRTVEPMMQLRLLTNRLFQSTILVSFFASTGFTGILFIVPLFLQEVRGASPLSSGLTTFPEALGVLLSSQIVARLYPRIGPRRLMFGGLLWVATAMSLLCLIRLESSAWLVRFLMFGVGIGMAYVFLPSQAASMATISRAATGRASTFMSVQRQLGAAVGVATVSTVLGAVGAVTPNAAGGPQPNLNAYHAAFLAAATLAVIGALMALRVPDRDAAPTMRPRSEPAGQAVAPKDTLVPDPS